MAKQSAVIRELVAVGAINAGGTNRLHKIPKADQVAVNTPRGEGAIARAMAAQYGAKRVLLIFDGGYMVERTKEGGKRGLSAEGRYLAGQLKGKA